MAHERDCTRCGDCIQLRNSRSKARETVVVKQIEKPPQLESRYLSREFHPAVAGSPASNLRSLGWFRRPPVQAAPTRKDLHRLAVGHGLLVDGAASEYRRRLLVPCPSRTPWDTP